MRGEPGNEASIDVHTEQKQTIMASEVGQNERAGVPNNSEGKAGIGNLWRTMKN